MAEQQQGTEYTLQGVMRFLQMEWHNHERARNAWDIERAEMKAKIAKQEGDCRSATKLNELLEKQIRMLEGALKRERKVNKAIAAGEEPPKEEDVKLEWGGKIGIKSLPNGDSDPSRDSQRTPESERESHRDKAKVFLQKCVEEITYLLTPPPQQLPHPDEQPFLPGPPDMPNPQNLPPSMAEAYYQQQQSSQHPQKRMVNGLSHLPSLPNNQPLRSAPEYYDPSQQQLQQQHQQVMSRQPTTQSSFDPDNQPTSEMQLGNVSRSIDDEVEKVTHSFDTYGRQIANTEEVDISRMLGADDNDGWNFDDSQALLEPPPDVQDTRRVEIDPFPNANHIPAKSPPRTSASHRRRSSGNMARRRSDGVHELSLNAATKAETGNFKVRFALRGHLDVIRSIIFTGGGSPSEPEICTTGDDGMIKRWIIPALYNNLNSTQSQPSQQQQQIPDLDVQSYFTHRGHDGMITCLASCPASASFSTGGRAQGDGWIFSGGQDATIRVWERGRIDPIATLDGHTDAVWTICVLPGSSKTLLGRDLDDSPTSLTPNSTLNVNDDRILLATGSADRTVKIWAVSAPPQLSSPSYPPAASRRGSRRQSVTSGSGFPTSPQPSIASNTAFHYDLIHSIEWPRGPAASPTCISPLGLAGESFVVSYSDSSILIFDTRTGDEIVGMASNETYNGTQTTGINSVVVLSTSIGNSDGSGIGQNLDSGRNISGEEETPVHGATGSTKSGGVEGVVISGHEDRFVRFFDANSGQCTYSMLAHPSSIASISLSPDGRELVSAGHDASLRFWSLEKRSCVQEITSHRLFRGEGVVSAVWSQDGKYVVSGGGDGVVKVFSR